MEEFFKAAQKHGLDLSSSGVSARDIVDGHREKTLILLWRIILYFQSCIQVGVCFWQMELLQITHLKISPFVIIRFLEVN